MRSKSVIALGVSVLIVASGLLFRTGRTVVSSAENSKEANGSGSTDTTIKVSEKQTSKYAAQFKKERRLEAADSEGLGPHSATKEYTGNYVGVSGQLGSEFVKKYTTANLGTFLAICF